MMHDYGLLLSLRNIKRGTNRLLFLYFFYYADVWIYCAKKAQEKGQ